MSIFRVLTVMHVPIDLNDDRVFKLGGVVMLLSAIGRRSVPLDDNLAHALT